MLKKSLLAGIALICLNPIQATQTTTNPQNPTRHEPAHREPVHPEPTRHEPAHHEPAQHEPTRHEPAQHEPAHHEPAQHEPAHHNTAHAAKDTKNCPCDGTGGKRAWVLIEANSGCSKEEAAEVHHKAEPHHTAVEEHPVTPHKPSLHPLPTPEEEKLAEELKPIAAHIFKRADPNNPQAEKRGESGKALHEKVYFQHLGIWKHDPSVHATTDIISTGVKERIRLLNEEAKKKQEAEKPASTEATKHHPVNAPDALGTTEGRVQSVRTEGKERQFGLGAPNKAQTGVTGKAIPEADTSESKAAVSPPSNIKAELAR